MSASSDSGCPQRCLQQLQCNYRPGKLGLLMTRSPNLTCATVGIDVQLLEARSCLALGAGGLCPACPGARLWGSSRGRCCSRRARPPCILTYNVGIMLELHRSFMSCSFTLVTYPVCRGVAVAPFLANNLTRTSILFPVNTSRLSASWQRHNLLAILAEPCQQGGLSQNRDAAEIQRQAHHCPAWPCGAWSLLLLRDPCQPALRQSSPAPALHHHAAVTAAVCAEPALAAPSAPA